MTAIKTKVLPISLTEFRRALITTCLPTQLQGPYRLAVAVSGGVDSMALAYLCSTLMHTKLESKDKFHFRALVVNHEAREGSAEEAQKVAGVLKGMAIKTDVLKLDWDLPPGQTPSGLSNFESVARRLRYQALARACATQDQGLLTAHHEDDQAETVLMRIVAGYTGRGLQGMTTRAEIPESHHLLDPSMTQTSPSDALQTRDNVSYVKVQPENALFVQPSSFITPGLYRPLLGFAKARLVETCRTAGIPWFEDPTNHDVTVTMRNTIRNLWKLNRLPSALNRDSMLSMASKIRARVQSSDAEGIAKARQLLKIVDLHSGTLKFTLQDHCQYPPSEDAALTMLERLTSWVSPQQGMSKSQLTNACKNVFRASPWTNSDHAADSAKVAGSFTISNVSWQRKEVAEDPESSMWILSRQPFARSDERACMWRRVVSSALEKPYDTWQLFDGRYWIKVHHRERASIMVQPLKPETLELLRPQLNAVDRNTLERRLSRHAPGRIRFTLPVLVDATTREVLALPTIGFVAPAEKQLMRWNVSYKSVLR